MSLTQEQKQFIDSIAKYVQKYAASYDIKVHSPIIAQAILESGWGKSALSAKYHNYFGLKCGTLWKGPSVNMSTQEEYTTGVLTNISDNFRVYANMEEGVQGYFEFIQLARYQNLKGITSPRQYLETIKADGYATSSTYVESTYALISSYDLTEYDSKSTSSAPANTAVVKESDRPKPGNWLLQYNGAGSGSPQHLNIIAVFNNSGLCTRYRMTQYDAWCATAVSAAFIATGLQSLFPCVECSCENMVKMAAAAGIWVENDAYVPNQGDVILYDWDDNGVGDNQGWSDHVGIVTGVSGNTITVVEGNKDDHVGVRNIQVNARFIRGFITPKYTGQAVSTPAASASASKKDIATIVKEVVAGVWGNGDDRKNRLVAAGYDYNAVQKAVNAAVGNTNPTPVPTKSVATLANEVLAGMWGNGDARRNAITAAGYDYAAVQAEVNRRMGAGNGKSIGQIAQEVIQGLWGNGDDRRNRLQAAGYDYNAVQAEVNRRM